MRTQPLFALLALATLGLLPACRTASIADPEARPLANAGAEGKEQTQAGVRRKVATDPGHAGKGTPLSPRPGHALAAFAAGCFWGVEDNFRQVPGVTATAVGYTGGTTEAPTYETVCSHTTGHAETVLVEFDPKVVSYDVLLDVFFKNHDPTTLNFQGPDHGDQYRSAIFTFSPEQDTAAKAAMAREQPSRKRPIVTAVSPLGRFWMAEDYHQQYDEKTGTHSCPMPLGVMRGGWESPAVLHRSSRLVGAPRDSVPSWLRPASTKRRRAAPPPTPRGPASSAAPRPVSSFPWSTAASAREKSTA